MNLLGLFIAFVGIQTLIFNACSALACSLMRVSVKKFVIFRGPKLARWHVGGCEVSLRLLPIGGFVEHDQEMLMTRNLGMRVLMSLSGLLGTACLGWLLLGGPEFLHYVQRTLVHLVPGTLHPTTAGVDCVRRFALLAQHSFGFGLGVAAAVNVALNLLPISMTPVFRSILEIGGHDFTEKTEGKPQTKGDKLIVVGCLLLLAVHAAWFVAIGMFFYRLMA